MIKPQCKVVAAAVTMAIVTGCASNEAKQPGQKTFMNQGQVDELVAVEPEMQLDTVSVAPAEENPYSSKSSAANHEDLNTSSLGDKVNTTTFDHHSDERFNVTSVQRFNQTSVELTDEQRALEGFVTGNWESTPEDRILRPFVIDEGESYKETIAKWLELEGYVTTRFILSESVDDTLDRDTDKDATIYNTIQLALNELSNQASKMGADYYDILPHDFRLYVSLNDATRSATVYSIGESLEIHHNGSPINTELVKPSQSYQLFKGETIESALYRWIGDVGYQKFGKLVDNNAKKILEQKVIQNDVINESFAQAATLLMLQAVEQAKASEKDERDGFISDSDKGELELHLFLDDVKREAILTSTNQPVVMFTVTQGSLRENFHNMSEFFGWNKQIKDRDSHYMARDYEIDFSYPIVAEKGNIKRALTDLLDGFPKLRGAIVPSTRTSYVVEED